MGKDEEIKISQKLDRVLYILENDDKTNRKGLVQDVFDLKTKVQDLQVKEKIDETKMTWLGVVGGGLFSILLWLVEYFLNKK